ncbi:hypothetical protein Tco_0870078 [Tanacetum coccineum]
METSENDRKTYVKRAENKKTCGKLDKYVRERAKADQNAAKAGERCRGAGRKPMNVAEKRSAGRKHSGAVETREKLAKTQVIRSPKTQLFFRTMGNARKPEKMRESDGKTRECDENAICSWNTAKTLREKLKRERAKQKGKRSWQSNGKAIELGNLLERQHSQSLKHERDRIDRRLKKGVKG